MKAFVAPVARAFGTAARQDTLRVVTVLGSTRSEGPPYPAPLGARVGKWIVGCARARGLEVEVVDPLSGDARLPLLGKPHFAYARGAAPAALERLSGALRGADAYLFVTPEYNHLPSPALLNLLNHFGASTFAFKPSAVVSYSISQWGGTRAALGLRTALLELGCLPVSAMVHVPAAAKAFDADGVPWGGDEKHDRWRTYADRMLSQLEFWGAAAKNQKLITDPNDTSPPFLKKPEQRNAP